VRGNELAGRISESKWGMWRKTLNEWRERWKSGLMIDEIRLDRPSWRNWKIRKGWKRDLKWKWKSVRKKIGK
jgi:hypothetical protein